MEIVFCIFEVLVAVAVCANQRAKLQRALLVQLLEGAHSTKLLESANKVAVRHAEVCRLCGVAD